MLNKAVFSPRTTFLIKPRPSQTIRLSFNRAFRAPSFVNSYMETTCSAKWTSVPPGPFRFPAVAVGNEQLKEEALTAYEAGYIGGFGRMTLGAALYLNDTKNMIQFAQAEQLHQQPSSAGLAVAARRAGSARRRRTRAAVAVHVPQLRPRQGPGHRAVGRRTRDAGVSAFANYSWQAEPKPTGFDNSELNLPPTHRFNAGREPRSRAVLRQPVGQLRRRGVLAGRARAVCTGGPRRTRWSTAAFGVRSTDGR